MTKRGILLDRDNDGAVVLTPEGEFLRLRLPDPVWSIGEEVTFQWPEPISFWKRWRMPEWIRQRPIGWASAALTAVVVAAFAVQFAWMRPAAPVQVTPPGEITAVPEPPVAVSSPPLKGIGAVAVAAAYVTVDINPSLELTLDTQARVVAVQALNADAEPIVAGRDWTGLTAQQAVEAITERAVELGFLAPQRGNEVVITTVRAAAAAPAEAQAAALGPQLEEALQAAAQQALRVKRVQAPVAVVRAAPEVREKARELHISAGKLNAWLRAQDQGARVKLDELQRQSVTAALRQAGIEPAPFLKGLHEEREESEKKSRAALNKFGDQLIITIPVTPRLDDERRRFGEEESRKKQEPREEREERREKKEERHDKKEGGDRERKTVRPPEQRNPLREELDLLERELHKRQEREQQRRGGERHEDDKEKGDD